MFPDNALSVVVSQFDNVLNVEFEPWPSRVNKKIGNYIFWKLDPYSIAIDAYSFSFAWVELHLTKVTNYNFWIYRHI